MGKVQKKSPVAPPRGSPLDDALKSSPKTVTSRPVPNPGGAQQELASEVRRIEQEMLDAAFARIRSRLENLPDLGALRTELRPVFDRVTSDKKLLRIMAGLDNEQRQQLKRQVPTLGMDILAREPWLKESLREAAEQAIRRIWSRVEDVLIPRVVELAQTGLRQGLSTREIAKRIELEAPGSARNPELLARDLIGSQLGELHQRRQTALGIKAYTWRTSRDERVVGNPSGRYPGKGSPAHGDHFHREGKVFLWRKEGERLIELKDGQEVITDFRDGHPGDPPLCRCWPQPYIPLLADLQTRAPGAVARAAEPARRNKK